MSRRAFTLLELMITIAISGIITAMMFSNFAAEKDRNNLKASVRQLQVDLQAAQTNAQSGILDNGVTTRGYGIWLRAGDSSYTQFSDQDGNLLHAGAGSEDRLTRNFPSGVVIKKVCGSTAAGTTADMVFTRPSGMATTYCGSAQPSTTIIIGSGKLSVCYAITVVANVGTVSQRQVSSCS